MLVRMWYARYLQSYLISRYMAPKGRGVLKNLILGIDFLPNYTSDFLEIFFLNRPKWAPQVFKISIFPFQNCERYSTHKLAKNQGPIIEPAWDEFFFLDFFIWNERSHHETNKSKVLHFSDVLVGPAESHNPTRFYMIFYNFSILFTYYGQY